MTSHKPIIYAHGAVSAVGKATGIFALGVFLSVLLCIPVIIAGCGDDASSENQETAAEDAVYERFNLKNPLNKRYQWSDFLGDPFIINFWATWCGPCRQEMPVLKKLYEEYHPEGLEIIGISLDGPRTRQLVVPFIEQFEVPWVILYGEQSVIDEFNPGSSIPTTLFFDADGNEVSRIVGAQPESVFRREMEKLFPSSP